MIIAATVITGPSSEIIGDALKSVEGLVDMVIVMDTGMDEATRECLADAGTRTFIFPDPWTGDFAHHRNSALAWAPSMYVDWAITLDTDERIHANGEDIRAFLKATPADVVMMRSGDDSYAKDRCFRIPAKRRWEGAVHEAYPSHLDLRAEFSSARFHELTKTPELHRVKLRRDVDALEKMIRDEPMNPRWWFYLGESFVGLGQDDLAVSAYWKCYELSGWAQESAWACYRAAVCEYRLGTGNVIDWCIRGLDRDPEMAELAWLAGWVSYQRGNYPAAIKWAEGALAIGPRPDRIGFANPYGQAQGPLDVIAWSMRKLEGTA